MYKSFYGLKEKPFSLLPDPAYLFLSKQHEMAMTLLEYSLENQAGFCVISGKAGTGKTTLVRRLLNQIGNDVSIGLISNTHHSFGELLRWILQAFNLEDTGKTRAQLHQIFVDYLIGQYAKNRRTMLIIDEAQNMSPDALEELRMLSNINSEKDLLLQVILVGQSPLRDILRQPELEQFAQRIAVDYHLESLGREETQGYIRHRILVAGGERELFTEDACDAVFDRSGGIPRLINLLCDYSLVYAYASQAAVVTGELVEQVVREREKYGALPVFTVTTEERANRRLPAKRTHPPTTGKLPAVSVTQATRKMVSARVMTVAGNVMPAEKHGNTVNSLPPRSNHESRIETKVRASAIDTGSSETSETSQINNDSVMAPVGKRVVTPLNGAISCNIPGGIETGKPASQPLASEKRQQQKVGPRPNESALIEGNRQANADTPPSDNSGELQRAKLSDAGIAIKPSSTDSLATRNGATMAKRYLAFAVVGGALLTTALIWLYANQPSGPVQAVSNKVAPLPAAPATTPLAETTPATDTTLAKAVPVSDRISDNQPLKKITPVTREGVVNPMVEKNLEREARLKAMERERDSALALARAAEREATRKVTLARERALAAEHDAAIVRERERANQLALAAQQERERANQLALAAEKAIQEARVAKEAAAVQERKPVPASPPQSRTTAVSGVARPMGFDITSKTAGTEAGNNEIDNEPTTFTANPCKGPSARFLSTCE